MPGIPADTPETIPIPLTVAKLVLLLLQVPPVDASVKAVVKPAQTLAVPVIAAGSGLTVTGVVIIQPVDSI